MNGNILDGNEGIILQQVNAQGVMGSGIAKAIRDKWPAVWNDYTAAVGPAYTQPESGAKLLGRVIMTSLVCQQFYRKQGELRASVHLVRCA